MQKQHRNGGKTGKGSCAKNTLSPATWFLISVISLLRTNDSPMRAGSMLLLLPSARLMIMDSVMCWCWCLFLSDKYAEQSTSVAAEICERERTGKRYLTACHQFLLPWPWMNVYHRKCCLCVCVCFFQFWEGAPVVSISIFALQLCAYDGGSNEFLGS